MMKDNKYYTIGEMAERLNTAPSTLRYYEKEGLLPFVERSSGGKRMFMQEILNTLEFKCWYYETAKESGTTKNLETLKLEELPKQFQESAEKLKWQSKKL